MFTEDGVHTLGPTGQYTPFEQHGLPTVHKGGRWDNLMLQEKLAHLNFCAEAPAEL